MPDTPAIARTLILLGSLIVLGGVLLWFFGKIPFLGRLPGDLVIRRGNATWYFPLATSILLSIVLTLLARFFLRR